MALRTRPRRRLLVAAIVLGLLGGLALLDFYVRVCGWCQEVRRDRIEIFTHN